MLWNNRYSVGFKTELNSLGAIQYRSIFPNPDRACVVPQSNPETSCLHTLEQVLETVNYKVANESQPENGGKVQ